MFRTGFIKGKSDLKIDWQDRFAANKLANALLSFLPNDFSVPIVFICIGTDRSTGDSLGPLVGSLVTERNLPGNFYVFGTLDEPIHAINLTEKLDMIESRFNNPFIIGIDACLGHSKNVGTIHIKNGSLKPGAGVNKTLPAVGDIHMTGIVNISGFMEYFVLQNTRLHLVMNLAKTMAEGIYKAGLLYHFEQMSKAQTLSLNEDTV